MDAHLFALEQAIEAAVSRVTRQTERLLALHLEGKPTAHAEEALNIMLENVLTLRSYKDLVQGQALRPVKAAGTAASTATAQQ